MTAAQLLPQLEALGVELREHQGRLQWRPTGNPIPSPIWEALIEQKEGLLELLRADTTGASIEPPVGWDPQTTTLIAWFQTCPDLPGEPFDQSPGVRVTDPPKFYRCVSGVIAGGPAGPNARLGQLTRDLKLLQLAARKEKNQ